MKITDSNIRKDVTNSFIALNKELYGNSDWDIIIENFLLKDYHLLVSEDLNEKWF